MTRFLDSDLVPLRGSDDLLKFGFILGAADDDCIHAAMPKGWTKRLCTGCKSGCVSLVDEKGVARAAIIRAYDGKFRVGIASDAKPKTGGQE